MTELSESNGRLLKLINLRWTLPVGKIKPQVYKSEALPYNGEKVFCVGIKASDEEKSNDDSHGYSRAKNSSLFFISVNLHKFGLRVKYVMVQSDNFESSMHEITDQFSETVQFFTRKMYKTIEELTENNSSSIVVNIKICLQSQRGDALSYELCDSSFKKLLWESCSKGLCWPDVIIEIIGSNNKFTAHKAILAARSPVLASKFKVAHAKRSTILRLNKLLPCTVDSSLANKELLELSVTFKVDSLEKICRQALKTLEVRDICFVKSMFNHFLDDGSSPSTELPIGTLVMNEDNKTAIYTCEWFLESLTGYRLASDVFSYQGRPLFVAFVFPETKKYDWPAHRCDIEVVTNPFCYYKVKNVEFQQIEASDYGKHSAEQIYSHWKEMQLKSALNSKDNYTVFKSDRLVVKDQHYVRFQLTVETGVNGHDHAMTDTKWSMNLRDFRFEAFTDVEMCCGSVKFFAHRTILALRSPVFLAKFNADPSDKVTIILENVEPACGLNFLKFLYTGTLPHASLQYRHQLEKLAVDYEIESLKKWLSIMPELPNSLEAILSELAL